MYANNLSLQPFEFFTGEELYEKLCKYILTEEQLQENGYPRPSAIPGTCIFMVDRPKLNHDSSKCVENSLWWSLSGRIFTIVLLLAEKSAQDVEKSSFFTKPVTLLGRTTNACITGVARISRRCDGAFITDFQNNEWKLLYLSFICAVVMLSAKLPFRSQVGSTWEKRYTCCQNPVGSEGCSVAEVRIRIV